MRPLVYRYGAPLWALEPFRFFVIGCVTVALNYLAFVALYELARVDYVVSLWIAFAAIFALSFYLHKRLTFRHTGTHRLMLRFALYALKQVALTKLDEIALIWCVEHAQLPPWFAQGVLTLLISGASYVLSRLIFKQRT